VTMRTTKTKRRRKSVVQVWTGSRQMKHSDFRVGSEFVAGSGRWRCTDIGKRTITAIRLNHDDDPSWYSGPPYADIEQVFDEYDIEGCGPAPKRRTYDASGRKGITIVPVRRAEGPRHKKSKH
jgi:hypothetical protein